MEHLCLQLIASPALMSWEDVGAVRYSAVQCISLPISPSLGVPRSFPNLAVDNITDAGIFYVLRFMIPGEKKINVKPLDNIRFEFMSNRLELSNNVFQKPLR